MRITDPSEHLAGALANAAGSPEYRAALEAKNTFAPFEVLAKIALRDGDKKLSKIIRSVPFTLLPGFREANTELAERFGVRFVMEVNSVTGEVTRVYLEPAKIVGDVIYAADTPTDG